MAESDLVATSTIAVHRGVWNGLAPELAALVAPPVSVSAAPLDRGGADHPSRSVGAWRRGQQARSRGNMPVRRHQVAAR
jgi:hypothetical protein